MGTGAAIFYLDESELRTRVSFSTYKFLLISCFLSNNNYYYINSTALFKTTLKSAKYVKNTRKISSRFT